MSPTLKLQQHILGSHPCDVELINYHLRPWLTSCGGDKAPFVHETDLYDASPAVLARSYAPAIAQNGDRAWYFLTRLRLKSPRGRGRRVARTVRGGGWWHGEAKERPVIDSIDGGRLIGRRQFFSFMRLDAKGARVRTGWIMAEFQVDAEEEEDRRQLDDLPVLCKVYRSPRHPGEHDVVVAETRAVRAAVARGPKGKVVERKGMEESSAPLANSGAAMTPPCDRDEKAAGDDNDSGEASVATPARDKDAVDDGTSSAAPRKRKAADDDLPPPSKRQTVDNDAGVENSDATREKVAAEGSTRPDGNGLHCCPQCGFKLGNAQLAAVGPAKLDSETGTVAQADTDTETDQGGDPPARVPKFYNFFDLNEIPNETD